MAVAWNFVVSLSLFIWILGKTRGEPCLFDQTRQIHQWLIGRDVSNSNVFLVDFNETFMSPYNTLNNPSKQVYVCSDMYTGSNGFLYHNLMNSVTGQYTCVQSYFSGRSILRGELVLNPSRAVTGRDCSTMLGSVPITWRTMFPTVQQVAFPFPLGRYQATVTSTPGLVQCSGDVNSYIQNTAEGLMMNLCAGTTFTVAMLYCLGTAPGALLGAEGDGNLMLLANSFSHDNNQKFYCAWYHIDGNHVYMSIRESDSLTILCDRNARYDTVAPDSTVTLLLTGSLVPQPACQLPTMWQGPAVTWWYNYDQTGQQVTMSLNGGAFTRWKDAELISSAICQDSYMVAPGHYVFKLFDGLPGELCMDWLQPVTSNTVLLEREVYVPGTTNTAASCAAAMGTLTRYRVVINDALIVEACPFIAETYVISMDDGTTQYCVNNAGSTMVVEGNRMSVSSCQNTNTYRRPFQTQLQCIASWPASSVDASYSAGDNFVIIAFMNQATGKLQYYCGRYSQHTVNNVPTYTLSLNIQNANTAYCETFQTPNTAGTIQETEFIKLVFTGLSTTTPTTSMTTTPTTTTSTAPLPCECMNGGICYIPTAPRVCSCPVQATGVLCETMMLNGPCSVDANACMTPGTLGCMDSAPLGFHLCVCNYGWTGDRCENGPLTTATPVTTSKGVTPTTITTTPTPSTVSTTVLPCECLNGGTCYVPNAPRQCSCLAHTTGTLCEILMLPGTCDVADLPCDLAGTIQCVNSVPAGYHHCICHYGWTGYTCDMGPSTTSSVTASTTTVAGETTPTTTTIAPVTQCDCMNGGICYIANAPRQCSCPHHTTGVLCEILMLPGTCALGEIPCDSAGTINCVDSVPTGFHFCVCLYGWTGFRCETGSTTTVITSSLPTTPSTAPSSTTTAVVPPCECLNGGVCYVPAAPRQCSCPQQTTGTLCEIRMLPGTCTLGENPCDSTGTVNCIESVPTGYHHCVCLYGWTGYRCETGVATTPTSTVSTATDSGSTAPTTAPGQCDCLNGGICYVPHAPRQCSCPYHTTGTLCEVLLLPGTCDLANNPCNFAGTTNCLDSVPAGYHQCVCQYGWTGYRCEIDVNTATTTPSTSSSTATTTTTSGTALCLCLNGGRCPNPSDPYLCICPDGFTGQVCQTVVPSASCSPNPCTHNGVCVQGTSSYTCVCPTGYGGTLCQEAVISSCNPNPCINGGTCVQGTSGFSCACPSDYDGSLCQNLLAQATTDSRLLLGLGLGLGLLLLIILILCLIFCCLRCQEKETEVAASQHTEHIEEASTGGKNLIVNAWYPDYTNQWARPTMALPPAEPEYVSPPPPPPPATFFTPPPPSPPPPSDHVFRVQLPAIMARGQPAKVNLHIDDLST